MSQASRARKVRNQGSRGRLPAAVMAVVLVVVVALGGWYLYGNSPQPAVSSATSSSSGTSLQSTSSGVLYAKLNTSMGMMEVELFPSAAPKTVANFVSLARSGFYDNLVWHRIVQGFVIQTGDPLTRNGGGNRSLWGTGGSPNTVPLEISSTLHNYAGYLGMARSQDPNSGSSQFYINLANNTSLDGQYTVFGRVISGMSVAYAIGNVPVNSADQPINDVFLISVTIQNAP